MKRQLNITKPELTQFISKSDYPCQTGFCITTLYMFSGSRDTYKGGFVYYKSEEDIMDKWRIFEKANEFSKMEINDNLQGYYSP